MKGTKIYGITFYSEHGDRSIVGYVDSDYVGDMDCRKSTIGYFFTLERMPIRWKSSVESIMAMSITKVEYMAEDEVVKEAL